MSPSQNTPGLFAGMSPEHVHILREYSSYAEFGAGAVIFQEGAPANSFFLIEQGKVALEANMEGAGLVQIALVQDGEPLGWSWLFEPQVWQFQARALQRTTTTCYNAGKLRERCEADHHFGYALLKVISKVMLQRLLSTRMELTRHYLVKVS